MEMIGVRKLTSSPWLPLIVTIPFSVIYQYVVAGVTDTRVSWVFVLAMNIFALVHVAYNFRQRRLVPFGELPRWVWAITLIALIALGTVDYFMRG